MSTTDIDDKARRLAAQLLHGPGPGEAPPDPPGPAAPRSEQRGPWRFDYPRARRFARWTDGLLRVHTAAASVIADREQGEPDNDNGNGNDDALADLVGDAHRMLLAHPPAARRAFAALVAEGRRHAQTPEGRELHRELLRSPRVQDAARLFRALAMGMLDEERETRLPSTYVDNLMRVVDEGRVEELAAGLLERLWERRA